MTLDYWSILGLLVFSALKFFLAPSAAVVAGYGFWWAIAISSSGGILGFLIFFYFGNWIKQIYQKIKKPKPKKAFSKKNKFIVKLKQSFGLYGVALLTPCLLGIPLGSALAAAYFSSSKKTLFSFVFSIILWSVILTYVSLNIQLFE